MVLFLFLDISFIQCGVVLVIKKISQQIVPICCGLVITYRQDSYKKKKGKTGHIWYGTIAYFVLHLAMNEASDFEKTRKRHSVALAWQGKGMKYGQNKELTIELSLR